MVSSNHGCKWFAVMVFTLSLLEHGWFRRNSLCFGPVYGPWLSLRFGCGPVYDSRLSLRVDFGPVYTQHLSSRTTSMSTCPAAANRARLGEASLLHYLVRLLRTPASKLRLESPTRELALELVQGLVSC